MELASIHQPISPNHQSISPNELGQAVKRGFSAPENKPIIKFAADPANEPGIVGFFYKLSNLLRSIFHSEGTWRFTTELDSDEWLASSSFMPEEMFHEGSKLRFEYVAHDNPFGTEGLVTQVYAQLYLKLTEPELLTPGTGEANSGEADRVRYEFKTTNDTSITPTQVDSDIRMEVSDGSSDKKIVIVSRDVTFDMLTPKLRKSFAGHDSLLDEQRVVIKKQFGSQHLQTFDELKQARITMAAVERQLCDETRQHFEQQLQQKNEEKRTADFLIPAVTCLSPGNISTHLSQMFPDTYPVAFQTADDYSASTDDVPSSYSRPNDISKADQAIHFDENTRLFMIKLYNKLQACSPTQLNAPGTSITITIDGFAPIQIEQTQKKVFLLSKKPADEPMYETYIRITVGKKNWTLPTLLSDWVSQFNSLNRDSLDFKTAVLLDKVVTLFSEQPVQQSDANTPASNKQIAIEPTPEYSVQNMLKNAKVREGAVAVKDTAQTENPKQYQIEFESEHDIPPLVMTPLGGNKVKVSIWEHKRTLENTTSSHLLEKLGTRGTASRATTPKSTPQNSPSKKQ